MKLSRTKFRRPRRGAGRRRRRSPGARRPPASPKRATQHHARRCSRRSRRKRAGLSAGGHAQRLDAAVAHERRLEGIPSRRRAGGARDRARHEGASLGLQRRIARPDHRGGRRRQGAHLRHQQAARAHHRALARHAAAERHGRRRRPDAAAHQARQDLRLRVRAEEERHLHVPPACRRDGADGDGHDGLLRRASARSRSSCASTATSSS